MQDDLLGVNVLAFLTLGRHIPFHEVHVDKPCGTYGHQLRNVIATKLKVDVLVRIALIDPDQRKSFLLSVIDQDSSCADRHC